MKEQAGAQGKLVAEKDGASWTLGFMLCCLPRKQSSDRFWSPFELCLTPPHVTPHLLFPRARKVLRWGVGTPKAKFARVLGVQKSLKSP